LTSPGGGEKTSKPLEKSIKNTKTHKKGELFKDAHLGARRLEIIEGKRSRKKETNPEKMHPEKHCLESWRRSRSAIQSRRGREKSLTQTQTTEDMERKNDWDCVQARLRVHSWNIPDAGGKSRTVAAPGNEVWRSGCGTVRLFPGQRAAAGCQPFGEKERTKEEKREESDISASKKPLPWTRGSDLDGLKTEEGSGSFLRGRAWAAWLQGNPQPEARRPREGVGKEGVAKFVDPLRKNTTNRKIGGDSRIERSSQKRGERTASGLGLLRP